MSHAILIDDGTMDTVIKCGICGQVQRYNPETENEDEDFDRVEYAFEMFEDDHECEPFEYYINLDERGEFFADVRMDGDTVFEIKGFEIFEDGFMKHAKDIDGLKEYLVDMGIMMEYNELKAGN